MEWVFGAVLVAAVVYLVYRHYTKKNDNDLTFGG